MKALFLRARKIRELIARVEENLPLYRSGSFGTILADPACYFQTELEIDESALSAIACNKQDINEVQCCARMYAAMGNLTPYLARDERLWIYLSHSHLLRYARSRWPIPDEDGPAVKHVVTHFFCQGARGIERDNAASRLWWMAALCNRIKGMPLEQALTCFLHQSDVRANIVERPTTSQSVPIFSAVLLKLNESYISDKSMFDRDRFRVIMKGLNLRAGVKLIGALPESAIMTILEECIAQAP